MINNNKQNSVATIITHVFQNKDEDADSGDWSMGSHVVTLNEIIGPVFIYGPDSITKKDLDDLKDATAGEGDIYKISTIFIEIANLNKKGSEQTATKWLLAIEQHYPKAISEVIMNDKFIVGLTSNLKKQTSSGYLDLRVLEMSREIILRNWVGACDFFTKI